MLAGILLLALPNAFAGGIEHLKAFVAGTRSAQAGFTQTVLDKNGKRIQLSSGTMQFVRPGKFRWEYRKPFEQLIVGDGAKFWLYDVDLNQVTVKKLNAALGSSPAALLSGSNEIERGFILKNDVTRDQLEWLEATPRNAESSFETVRMGFNSQSDLVAMELRDAFGHLTVLQFSGLKRNPPLAPALFKFTAPKDADVLAE